MNRILCYLQAGTSRQQRDHKRLKALAAELTATLDLGDVVHVYVVGTDDEPPYLAVSIISDWRIDHERTAREEICETLETVAAQLTAAVARLEGGAA